MSKKLAVTKERIVHPIIIDEACPHPWETLEDEGDLPELTSVGFARVGKTNRFVSYVMKSKGTEILRIDVAEPDVRGIAEDACKISFVEHLGDPDEDMTFHPSDKSDDVKVVESSES